MRPLNLDMENQLVRVEPRTETAPKLSFANGSIDTRASQKADWNLAKRKFVQQPEFTCIHYVRISTQRMRNPKVLPDNLQVFHSSLLTAFGTHGIRHSCPDNADNAARWNLGNVHQRNDLQDEVWEHFKDWRKKVRPDPKSLTIVILPQKDPAFIFSQVKDTFDRGGLHNICVRSEKGLLFIRHTIYFFIFIDRE